MKRIVNLLIFLSLILLSHLTFGQNVAAQYVFNGNADDISGNGINGTVNSANLTLDRFATPESAYQFDGVDDYINLGNDPAFDLKSGLSFSLWLNITSSSGFQTAMSRGYGADGEYSLDLLYSNGFHRLVLWVEGQQYFTEKPLPEGWNHVVVIMEEGVNGLKIYLNGRLNGEFTSSTDVTGTSPFNLHIGNDDRDNAYFFQGGIDDVIVFDSPPSIEIIEELASERGTNYGIDKPGFGSALNFDGEEDFVVLPTSSLNGITEFTVETWIRWKGGINRQVIWNYGVSNSELLYLEINNSRPSLRIGGVSNNQLLQGNQPLSLNQWNHVALSMSSSGEAKIYLDGVLVGSQTMNLTPSDIAPFYHTLGFDPVFQSDQNKLNADLDETRLWNEVRSLAEVNEYQLITIDEITPGLVYNYNYDDGIAFGDNRSSNILSELYGNYDGEMISFELIGSNSNYIKSEIGVGNLSIDHLSINSAVAGNNISIIGRGFTQGVNSNTVLVGSTEAIVNTATERRIEITMPQLDFGPGVFDITVSNANGVTHEKPLTELYTDSNYEFGFTQDQVDGDFLNVQDIIEADIDNDGDLDILSGYWDVSWIENLGNGVFDQKKLILENCECQDLGLFDINNDGDLDLFISQGFQGGRRVSWVENLGGGIFSSTENHISAAGNDAFEIDVTDLDEDGDYDILVAHSQEGIFWYNNSGDNLTFVKTAIYATTEGKGVDIIDVNNDGHIDVLAAVNNGEIIIFKNDGSAAFTQLPIANTNLNERMNFEVADFNGDGFEDFAAFNLTSFIFLSNGDETYSQTSLPAAMWGGYAGDAEGDGDIDLFLGANLGTEISMYENDGAGNFTKVVLGNASFQGSQDLAAADFDNDGDLDPVSVSSGDGQMRIFWHVNTGKDFTSFSIPDQVGGAEIDVNEERIDITIPFGLSLKSIVPEFTSSFRSSVYIEENLQFSGFSLQNFTEPVTYTLFADDLSFKIWTVYLHPLPETPFLFEAFNITDSSATIEWTDSQFASRYELEYSEDNFTTVNTVALSSSFTNIPLAAGTSYRVRVKARNSEGFSEDYSNVIAFTTVPPRPVIRGVNEITQTTAILGWERVKGADYYLLDVGIDPEFNEFVPGYEGRFIFARSETIIGLRPGATYYADLTANNDFGESGFSEVFVFKTLPAVPEIKIEQVTQNSISVSWEPVNGADNYQLEIYDGVETTIRSYTREFTETISSLNPATTYSFRISASHNFGNSGFSEALDVVTIPVTPSNFNLAAVEQQGAVIEWDEVDGATNYLVELSSDNFSTFISGFSPKSNASNFEVLNNLVAGRRYQMRVRSANRSGRSPYSEVFEFAALSPVPTITTELISQTRIVVSWEAVNGAESYHLEIDDGLNSSERSYSTQFVDTISSLDPATLYSFRIRAAHKFGSSGFSEPLEVITIPATPSNLTLTSVGQNAAVIEWDNVEGATNYLLELSDDNFSTFISGFNPKLNTIPSEVLNNLAAGRTYQMRIRSANSSGSSPNSTVFQFVTIPATPVARDASSVTDDSFNANWDGVDGQGITYIVEVANNSAFDPLINSGDAGSNLTQAISGLEEGVSHWYRIAATNNAGTSPFSNIIFVEQPLSIENINYPVGATRATTSTIPLSFEVKGGQNAFDVNIRYRGILVENWTSIELQSTDGIYNLAILPDFLDEIGLEFEIMVDDGEDVITNVGNFIYWTDIEEQIPFENMAGEWQMFSIPYNLEDNLIDAVFDEMGPFNYRSEWRLMQYDGQRYVDAGGGINRIVLGNGYWFNSLQNIDIKIGAGTVNTESPFVMSLRQGWNQIGNPYNVPISWNSVRQSNAANTIVNEVILYNSSQGTFFESDNISPFEGGFVWADEPVSLEISFVDNKASSRIAEEQINQNIDNEKWQLDLFLDELDMKLGSIGMHPEANKSKDAYDKLVVPRFIKYLEFYTLHNEFIYPWFNQDIQPSSKEKSWLFNMESNYLAGASTISWDQEAIKDAEAQLWLIDENTGSIIDMKSIGSYTLQFAGHHQISIHYSENMDAPAPFILALGNPYPNPTNGTTSIRLSLPDQKSDYRMLLEIYDTKGNKIETLGEGTYKPGIYEFTSDLEKFDLSGGMYLYRMVIEGHDPIYKKVLFNR